MQILADVAGLPITLTETADAVSLGSAMCAAVGAGAFANLHEASRAMVHPSRTIEPNPSTHARLSRKIRALQRNLYCTGSPFSTCQQQILSLSLLEKKGAELACFSSASICCYRTCFVRDRPKRKEP